MTHPFLTGRRRLVGLLLAITLAAGGGCARRPAAPCIVGARVAPPPAAPAIPSAAAVERDEIYLLTAMGVVFRDWQSDTGPSSRGYNIGSVLVDPDGRVVAWGRNCNRRTGNSTQHGEVRLIQGYLAVKRSYYLDRHVVYTTLEPCAQCSGMMVLAKIGRVVYAQADPDFGKAMERLGLDSRALPMSRGYAPYPRAALSEHAVAAAAGELDARFAVEASRPDGRPLVEWLASDEAREIYRRAVDRLRTMTTRFPENAAVLSQAREFLDAVPDHYVPIFPWDPPTPAHGAGLLHDAAHRGEARALLPVDHLVLSRRAHAP